MIKTLNELLTALLNESQDWKFNVKEKYDTALLCDKANVLEIIKVSPLVYEILSDELKNDDEIIRLALSTNGYAYKYLSLANKENAEYAKLAIETSCDMILENLYAFVPFNKVFLEELNFHELEWIDYLPDIFYQDGEMMVELFEMTKDFMAYDDFIYDIPLSCLEDIDYMKHLVKYNYYIMTEADDSIRRSLLRYVKKEDKADAKKLIEEMEDE